MAAEDIRTFLARIFLGKAKVRSLRPEERKVELQSLIEASPIAPIVINNAIIVVTIPAPNSASNP